MSVETYLGNPPQRVIDWIRNHSQPATPSLYFTYDSNRVITGLYQGEPNVYKEGTYEDWNETYEDPETGEMMPTIKPYSGWTYGGSDVVENYATAIEEDAFYNNNYTIMDIPPSKGITGNITFQNVISIRPSAFQYCSGLTSVIIPNVTNIYDSAFLYCDSLTTVTIGSRIQEIGNSVFFTNGSPVTLTIDKTVAEVQAMGTTDYNAQTNVPYSEWGLPSGSTIVCTDGTIIIE